MYSEKIKISSQDGRHQYDESGNIITTWDGKKCAWIVNEAYENADIDWYGEDSDFPAGCTLARFIAENPNWDKMPDIHVTWTWNTKESYKRFGGHPSSFGASHDYYEKLTYPFSVDRSWGYIDCPESEAVNRFGKHCDFDKKADLTTVTYNGKVIFEGKFIF